MTPAMTPVAFRIALPFMLAAALLLSACATVDARGFTRAQTRTLVAHGFVETAEGWELSMADRLLFAVDSAVLRPEMHDSIDRIATSLLRVGITSARVEGHTDSTGSAAHNERLALARAAAMANALTHRGFAHDRLVQRGWGAARPVADNATEEGRAQNRRVVIIVTAQ